jgi:uncharacterized membrane protein
MIADRMEEGLSEEEAVVAVGSPDEIAASLVAEPFSSENKKEKVAEKRRLRAGEITLLAVGSPVWVSLLIAAFAVVISLYASLWAIIISLWACFGALVGGAFGGVFAGIVFALTGNGLSGIALIGGAAVCAGLSILAFFGCRAAGKGAVWLTKKMVQSIKHTLTKKEEI